MPFLRHSGRPCRGAIDRCSCARGDSWPHSGAAPASTPPPAAAAGGLVHGTVKAGNVPLPGVSIVATNTLTGQRYATITDINGNYSMTIPKNGRYVLKTELAAFAPETKVALLKPTAMSPANQQADFALTLASRVPPESPQENVAGNPGQRGQGGRQAGTVRRNTGGGAQNLALLAALAGTEDAGINSGATGATLPSLANSADFSTDSVAVTGQSGTTNPFAGVDMEQLRQNAELDQSLGGGGFGGPGGGGGQGGDVLEAAVLEAAVLEEAVLEAAVEEASEVEAVTAEAGVVAVGVRRRFRRWGFRQFPQLQAQSAPWRVLLDGGKQRAECPALPHSWRKRNSSPATRRISSDLPLWARRIFRTWSSTTQKT